MEALLKEWKNKDVVKPQDLAMSWYYNFLHDDFTQGRTWTWARENWDWIKKDVYKRQVNNNVLWSLALVLLLMSLAFNSVIKLITKERGKKNYAR